jgi:large subunit ribosomal protein L15
MVELHRLPTIKRRPKKRVGRGYGSGKGGHTVGRGQKGQKTRSKIKLGFEGGQLPLYRRLPHKRGFKRAFREEVAALNVGRLKDFAAGEIITPSKLREAGLFKTIPRGGVKLLGQGEIKKKLTVKGFKLSKTAAEKIIKAGGKVE